MKKLIVIALIGALWSCGKKESSYNKESEFFVRGNCEMCKTRIEETVANLEGVASATWDVNSSALKVKYDSTKVNETSIHKAVASKGHGTKNEHMDQKAHDDLPECCKLK